jgi:hypothetical protein
MRLGKKPLIFARFIKRMGAFFKCHSHRRTGVFDQRRQFLNHSFQRLRAGPSRNASTRFGRTLAY